MATGGLLPSKSSSSSVTCTSSTAGLSAADGEDVGVSTGNMADKASLSDSTLTLVPVSSPPSAIFEGGVGEGGDDGIDSRGRAVRRLRVTLLDVGSGTRDSEGRRRGVRGRAGSASPLRGDLDLDKDPISESRPVSTDRLREPPLETRCRFREEDAVSSKGFGRVEQGSEEAARSCGSSGGEWSWSIGQGQQRTRREDGGEGEWRGARREVERDAKR